MAQKTPKMSDDVKRPDKVTPSPTSRPLLIANESAPPSDPMVVQSDEDKKEEIPMTHSERKIMPLNPDVKPEEEEATAEAPASDDAAVTETKEPDTAEPKEEKTDSEPEAAKDKKNDQVEASTEEKEPESKPETAEKSELSEDKKVGSSEDTSKSDEKRDPEAAMTAEEAAKIEAQKKRNEELETLAVSGKYAVPIDAVQRKRSRTDTIFLCILALVLLVVLADAVADVGIVKVPSSIPHTHFFSK